MSKIKTLLRSFAAGVVAPEMFGRLDLVQNQTGLSEAVNMITLPHGPFANRTGTDYVLEVKNSTLLTVVIPFIYSTSQSMVVELGNLYARFHTTSGTVLEAAQNITAITQANPGVVTIAGHGYTSGQWVWLTGIGGMTLLNGRYVKVVVVNANTFSLTDLGGAAINTTAYAAFTSGGSASRVYEIATPYLTANLLDLHYAQSADVLTIVHPSYQQAELRRLGATNWTLTNLAFAPTIGTPAAPTVVATGAGGTTYTYSTTAIATSTLEESVASATTAITNELTTPGQFNTITPAVVAGAIRYNVYKLISGLYGYIGQTDGAGFKDNNITPDTTRSPSIPDTTMSSSNNWPGAVGYFQGRRWFGGTLTQLQNIFATKSGTESNMGYSLPAQATDRINIRIAARQAQTIRHFIPLGELLFLTSGGEWSLLSGNAAITGSSIDPRLQGGIGSNNVQPIITNTSVLYAQDRGGRVREMQYTWQQAGYKTVDKSIFAPHLFDTYSIMSMAWTRGPLPIAWFVRSDGTLLGFTYIPEQQIGAWHTHTTDGTFESVCAVPEGNEDVLYATVKRTINGRTVRAVERLHSRAMATLSDAYYVDCGLTYTGTAATTISGLWHLIAKTVNILANGAVVEPQVVSATGTITLPSASTVVHIGLPIVAQAKTLPIAVETEALGQGAEKNVDKLFLRVNRSSGLKAGPSYAKLKEVKQRTTEPYGSPPDLMTGEVPLVITSAWNPDGQVCIQQDQPLPVTVLSMTIRVAIGD